MRHPGIVTLLLAVWASAAPAQPDRGIEVVGTQGRRVALVIGNGSYAVGPLRNPVNDARAVADELRRSGFSVILSTDQDQLGMKQAVQQFGRALSGATVGLFYYAGHGVQAAGKNWLIPVGAPIQTEADLHLWAVDTDQVLAQMEESRTQVNVVILDACRDNPLARSTRSGSRGLAQVSAPVGTLIAYSTHPGATASDGSGANGLYTEELLRFMRMPGISIEEVFKQVRIAVARRTGNRQVPWISSSLVGDLFLRGAPTDAPGRESGGPSIDPRPEPGTGPRPSGTTGGFDLDLASGSWWTGISASGRARADYTGGAYRLAVVGTDLAVHGTAVEHGLSPVRIETSFTFTSRGSGGTPAAGIRFGKAADGSYYVYRVTLDGKYQLRRWVASERRWTDLITPSAHAAVHSGLNTVNRLAVEIRGRALTLFANGSRVDSYELEAEPARSAAVTLSGTTGHAAAFTRLSARPPGAAVSRDAGIELELTSGNWWTGVTSDEMARIRYTGGGYRIDVLGPGRVAHGTTVEHRYPSVRLETTVRFVSRGQGSTPAAGLRFGIEDDGSFYTLRVTLDGKVQVRRRDGRTSTWSDVAPAQASGAVQQGRLAVNRVAVEIRGRNLTFFVNGSAVGARTLPAPPRPNVAVTLSGGTGDGAVFTRLSARPLPGS